MSFALRFPRLSALVVGALTFLRRAPRSDVLAARPRVTPDPQHAAEIEKRFGELDYSPENGFIRDQRQERAQ